MKFAALLCLLVLYTCGLRDVIAQGNQPAAANLISEPVASAQRAEQRKLRSTDPVSTVSRRRENDFSPWLEFTNQLFSDDDEDTLNVKDAQLARLHGLGPAEISQLSSWQQDLLQQDNPPPQGFASPQTFLDDANNDNDVVEERGDRIISLWSKRSSKSGKSSKQEKQNNRNREKSGQQQAVKLATTSKALHKPIDQSLSDEGPPNPQLFDRNSKQQQQQSSTSSDAPVVANVGRLNRNLATQFLLRSPRENRKYDVPIIECPPAEDGMERFACPTKDRMDRYRCIDDHVLCDGFVDCPGAEDEDRQACMFYKTMKAHLDVVADALLRWVHGR